MEFIIETIYNQESITAMAKAMRKTVRRKRNKRTRIAGWIIIILALLLTIPSKDEEFVLEANMIVTWIVVLIMGLVILFEDNINAYIAKKRMVMGTEKAVTEFKEESYISTTDMGKTEWYYKNIIQIAETKEYFIFIFDNSHAQIYDKNKFTKGTVEEFRTFICEKTGKEIKNIS